MSFTREEADAVLSDAETAATPTHFALNPRLRKIAVWQVNTNEDIPNKVKRLLNNRDAILRTTNGELTITMQVHENPSTRRVVARTAKEGDFIAYEPERNRAYILTAAELASFYNND